MARSPNVSPARLPEPGLLGRRAMGMGRRTARRARPAAASGSQRRQRPTSCSTASAPFARRAASRPRRLRPAAVAALRRPSHSSERVSNPRPVPVDINTINTSPEDPVPAKCVVSVECPGAPAPAYFSRAFLNTLVSRLVVDSVAPASHLHCTYQSSIGHWRSD